MAKIMLVEDDNNLREIYEARLLAEGYEVLSAKDGEEALALATKERPDLIISDVMMPKISGFDMLDILRSTPGIENTKVVMMTALSQAEDKARADKLGADKYLVKSQVTLEDVARVADELLNGTSTESAPINQTEQDSSSAAITDTPVTQEPVELAPAPAPEPAAPQPTVVAPTTPTPAAATPAPEPDQTIVAPAPAATDNVSGATTTDESTNNPQDNTTTTTPSEPATTTDASTPLSSSPTSTLPPSSSDTPAASTPTQAAPTPDPAAASTPTAPTTTPENTELTTPANTLLSEAPAEAATEPSTATKPVPEIDTQTTAEEEAVIDAQIDDFVKNQLHSNEPPAPEPEPAAAPQQQSHDSELAGSSMPGQTIGLPTQAPTETIAVKSAPGATEPQTSSTPEPLVESPKNVPAPEPKKNSSQRVIQPMNDLTQKPDLNQLAEEEEQQTQGPLPASSVIAPNGETLTPPNPNATPNDHDPGNIIQPSNQSHDPNDPANIAL